MQGAAQTLQRHCVKRVQINNSANKWMRVWGRQFHFKDGPRASRRGTGLYMSVPARHLGGTGQPLSTAHSLAPTGEGGGSHSPLPLGSLPLRTKSHQSNTPATPHLLATYCVHNPELSRCRGQLGACTCVGRGIAEPGRNTVEVSLAEQLPGPGSAGRTQCHKQQVSACERERWARKVLHNCPSPPSGPQRVAVRARAVHPPLCSEAG